MGCVGGWEEEGKDGTAAEEVLCSEGVELGIMRGFVVVEHQVEDVALGCYKDDFEGGVPGGGGERPEEVWRVVRWVFWCGGSVETYLGIL